MTLKIGMLGFAHVHAPGFAECLRELPDADLVAIADEDSSRLAAAVAAHGCEPYADYRKLLARDDIAAVVVMSPTSQHRELVVAAAEAGKHVLCEKPLATTHADAMAIVEACQRHGVKLQTAFPMRYSPPAITLRRIVREGAIGTPLMVKATNQGQYPGGWFGDPHLAGGGAIMDHVVHVADMLRWIFEEEIVEVYAEVDTRLHPGMAVDDVAILTLTLANGLTTTLDPSWSRPRSWPIWGGLTMDVIGDSQLVALDAFRENLELIEDAGPSHRLLSWGVDSNLALTEAFIDAIRDDTEPPITGEDGLKATEVALCAYESAKRREPVACPGCLVG